MLTLTIETDTADAAAAYEELKAARRKLNQLTGLYFDNELQQAWFELDDLQQNNFSNKTAGQGA